jgi:hypothetical protein
MSLRVGNGDRIVLVTFVTFILVIPAAPWHPERKYVIRVIVAYTTVWVIPSDFWLRMPTSEVK